MGFGDSFLSDGWVSREDGERNAAAHRAATALGQKVKDALGLGLYVNAYRIRVEVWPSVAWVCIPGRRPQFMSRKKLGV